MKEVTKIESEYLHRNVSVGIIVPDKVEKIVVLLHGRDGSFKALDDNLPLTRIRTRQSGADYHA